MASSARIALVLIDGIGDVSLPSLGYRSPLEAAHTPHMDAIAAAGINGLMDPVEPGLACGSDTAHLSLLGYNPRLYYRGRGAFESMGAGIPMAPGDIAFKSNFATLDEETGIVVSRRADRHFEREGPLLCADLDGLRVPGFPECTVSVKYATEHRCGVVVRGPGLSGEVGGTDPLKDGRPLREAAQLDGSPEAARTAAVVAAVSGEMRRRLRAHPLNAERAAAGKPPANCVLLRGCGILVEVPSFREKHGLQAAMVAPTKIIAGLGLSLGVPTLECPGGTGDYRTLLSAKAEAVAAALAAPLGQAPRIVVPGEDEPRTGDPQGYDFGFLHIKAIDDAGHDKAPSLKLRGLEAVDRMIGQLAARLWAAQAAGAARYVLCVTADHSTPVLYGDHSYEPVPFAACHLADYVRARGGESVVTSVSMEEVRVPTEGEGPAAPPGSASSSIDAAPSGPELQGGLAGDAVALFSESAAARGCLGRFSGCEMMGILKAYVRADARLPGG